MAGMSADATTILGAVNGVIALLYPLAPIYTSKRRTTDGRNMQAGWQSGFAPTCFVLSCKEAEDIDAASPSFVFLTVGYHCVVEYIKPAQQTVANAPNTGAATVVEDPDVRAVRAALRAALFKASLAAAPTVFHVKYRTLPVYEQQGETGATLLVSGQQFTYFTTEPRPHP